MFTATEGVVLPTTVTGSWPKPAWFTEALGREAVSARLNDIPYREQFLDAVAALISDQERAGLDIMVNGDYHFDNDLGGMSWAMFNALRLAGVDLERRLAQEVIAFPPGTILSEVMSGWRFPQVVDQLGVRIPFELDTVWRAAQSCTTKPVKIGTISAQTLAAFLRNESEYYDDDKQQLTWDLCEILNGQLHELARAGCKVIQIEDPMIHLAKAQGAPDELIDFFIDAVNRETAGLGDECEVWIHTCWGNPNMQRAYDETPYAPTLEKYLYRVNCDVLTVEMCDRHFDEIELFGNYRDVDKKIAIGVVSHRSLQVDSAETIAANIRTCLEFIPPERLVLSSDCGFGRQGFNRLVAFHKAASIVRATNLVRAELGAATTPQRSDDPLTQLAGRRAEASA